MSGKEDYWKKPKAPHSIVKSAIVAKYFAAWSNVMSRQGTKVGYIDLYAGKGEGANNEPSTAVEVLKIAAEDAFLQENLVVVLNDYKSQYCKDMARVVKKKGYDTALRQPINITNMEVSELLADQFSEMEFIPSLFFIDPYGFKGVSLDLIRSIIKDWGCDIVLFFHTSGINRNLTVEDAQMLLCGLFGIRDFNDLNVALSKTRMGREDAILEVFRQVTASVGVKHFLPLRFNFPKSERLSHHLVFMTKHPLGFSIMKEVMASYSQMLDDVPLWRYVEGRRRTSAKRFLRGFGPMAQLKAKLRNDFAGQELAVKEVLNLYDLRSELYNAKTLKTALLGLEADGLIVVDKPAEKRPKRNGVVTLGDKRRVNFLVSNGN